ncbi:hypothetical protein A0H81_04568 [Grifola frondosa]|uniref:PIN domain-containing protein n=1 Tax=Grifola frondosa TaxID=5627 RepID=A0A1C7MEZ3_GRIFR|nr:hypothetical protein A0H81_04568 [Grifola frondosa]
MQATLVASTVCCGGPVSDKAPNSAPEHCHDIKDGKYGMDVDRHVDDNDLAGSQQAYGDLNAQPVLRSAQNVEPCNWLQRIRSWPSSLTAHRSIPLNPSPPSSSLLPTTFAILSDVRPFCMTSPSILDPARIQESPTRLAVSSRKGKEREPAQSTDIAERIFAIQRKQAAATRGREKPERVSQPSSSTSRTMPPHQHSPRKLHTPPTVNSNILVSQTAPAHMEADPDEFSRLKISATSPRGSHTKPQTVGTSGLGKLYNPNTDSARRPVITAEPDNISDATSSSYAPRGPSSHPRPAAYMGRGSSEQHRQLFDHRKDDPVRFSVLTRSPVASGSPLNSSQNGGRPTPTPKSSGDWVSASSTSSASYAQSTISSNFTLSSTSTDASSASSALFDSSNPTGRTSEDSATGTNAFSMQLKKLYRAISALENKILGEDRDRERDEDGERDGQQRVRVLFKGPPSATGLRTTEVKGGDEEAEKERWQRLIKDHEELAEKMRNLLELTLAPSVPASLRNIPTKYNLIPRLWLHAFQRLLESLRRAAMPPNSSELALEHLQVMSSVVFNLRHNSNRSRAYAAFRDLCVHLLWCTAEHPDFASFRSGWLEALGDLSRYFLVVSMMADQKHASNSTLTISAIARNNQFLTPTTPRPSTPRDTSIMTDAQPSNQVSPTPAARIDDSPPSSHMEAENMNVNVASVGVAAARAMELESDKDHWRRISKEWFSRALAVVPNTGKLHHHLGVLIRDRDMREEDMRGVYHFVKRLSFRCGPPAQTRRQALDAQLSELFLLMHGMLFTNIQLDDFKGVLERFQEKLQIEGGGVVEEREWIMMAVTNIASVLEYGRPTALLRRVANIGGPNSNTVPLSGAMAGKVKLMMAKRLDDDKKMDVDEEEEDGEATNVGPASPVIPEAPVPSPNTLQLPASLQLAMQLTFSMLSLTFQHPRRRLSQIARPTMIPYITVLLTFLATLAAFLNSIPRKILLRELKKAHAEGEMLLTSGCVPLPEDWCLRGLGWTGKRVFERGFWQKGAGAGAVGEERNIEVEVLDRVEERNQVVDGVIEDEDNSIQAESSHEAGEIERWVRVARAGLKIVKYVDGFVYVPATTLDARGEFKVDGVLAQKVERWKEEERREREEDERRHMRTGWDDDSMDVDDDEGVNADDESSEDSEDDEEDSAEIRALKARRRYLRSLLQSSSRTFASPSAPRRSRGPAARKAAGPRRSVHVVPGYTVLVVDTNILLSSLSTFASLVESHRWTVVVPLPVIMELDGLAKSASPLGEAAANAVNFITSHIHSHSTSLKVLTSRGNYLSSLSIRTELVDFADDEASWERNMDDLILRATIWQDEHWVDRSALLKSDDSIRDTTSAAKVVLLSFDRMLRLKARSRQLSAANEQDLASIFAAGT